MGTGRKTSQVSGGRSIPGPAGVFDQQEKEPEEQQGLIRALTGTLHHFFGGFSPSLGPGYRPPGSAEDPLSPRESGLRRGPDVPLSTPSKTTNWVVAPERARSVSAVVTAPIVSPVPGRERPSITTSSWKPNLLPPMALPSL